MRRYVSLLALLALGVCGLSPAGASASAAQPNFWKRCKAGRAAGQCLIPRGIGADPDTGHVYVADQGNSRIVELSAWGEFVKAWGWGVKNGTAELQTCTEVTSCQQGLTGSGKGEFGGVNPQGVAVDSAGDVYVVDRSNHRIQKFDPNAGVGEDEAEFLLMFGGEVNETSGGNLCPRPGFPADVCKQGTTGTANGQFEAWPVSSFIAIGPSDQVYVGDKGRIQEFDSGGVFQKVLPDPDGLLSGGKQVGSLAADPVSGDLYLAYPNPEVVFFVNANHNVFRIDPATGAKLDTLEVGIPRSVATAPDGSVYAFDQRAAGNIGEPGNHITRLLRFDDEGKQIEVVAENESAGKEQTATNEFNTSTGIATGGACFEGGHGVYLSNSTEASFVSAYGTAPDKFTGLGEKCEPPQVPPTITDQYAISVGAGDATLGATINPHFWPDTTYYLEYGTGKCSEGGCPNQIPTPPGSELGGGAIEGQIPTAGTFLTGLNPATTYHYRFASESGGGGPVFGIDPDGEEELEEASFEDGLEATFTTFPEPETLGPCPNEAFRIGFSSALPDCRAYEMVSPVDKEGGDVAVQARKARLEQSAASGDGFTYSSNRPFADPKSAPFSSQYLAHREAGVGWTSKSISAPQEGENLLTQGEFTQIDSLFKVFSPDLATAWNLSLNEPVLGPGGLTGFPNLYRRDNTGEGSYQACTTAEPIGAAEVELPEMEGASADLDHAVFTLRSKLTPQANTGSNAQLYECSFDEAGTATVQLISALPDGSASAIESTAGTGFVTAKAASQSLRAYWLAGAISEDGSRVFWTASNAESAGPLYVRDNADRPESARLHGAATGTGDLVGPVGATGTVIKGLTTVTGVKETSGKFVVGQEITSPTPNLISPETKIVAVEAEAGKLKLSKAAEGTKAGAELTGVASATVSNLTTKTGAFAAGQEISGPGIPTETTILALAPGSLTLSVKATQTKTGAALSATSECTEAAKACTYPLSVSEPARFWGATADGSQALFAVEEVGPEAGNLYLFDVDTAIAGGSPKTLIAGETLGVLGMSEDLSRIYFLSEEEIGGEGAAGKPNLYLYEAGEPTSFIATLSALDTAEMGEANRDLPSPVSRRPDSHTSRVGPDGSHLAFMSSSNALSERVAGYDNTDITTGEPDAEVYRFALGEGLDCVSCNRTGARPSAGRLLGKPPVGDALYAIARLAPWMTSLHPTRALSEEGSRVFFESYEPLVLTDTNGKADVYQWEEEGVGDCEEEDAAFIEASGGCVSLISSGKSPADSEFFDADTEGNNAFFTTASSLLPQDPGAIDLYDARVNGGFAPQAPPPAACEGEACQSPPEAPEDPTPASSSFQGAGNVREEAAGPKPCTQGKVRRKGLCVSKNHKRAHKRHHRRANHDRGGAR